MGAAGDSKEMGEDFEPLDSEPLSIDPTGELDEFLIFGSPETRRRFLKQVAGTGAAITLGPSLLGIGSVEAAATDATVDEIARRVLAHLAPGNKVVPESGTGLKKMVVVASGGPSKL